MPSDIHLLSDDEIRAIYAPDTLDDMDIALLRDLSYDELKL